MNASALYFQASNARALDDIEKMLHEDATYETAVFDDDLQLTHWPLLTHDADM